MHTKLELYQKVTPLAQLGIWERNLLTGIVYWNSVIREIYEVPESFVPSLDKTLNFYHDENAMVDLIDGATRTGQCETAELEITTYKGTNKWVKVRIQGGYEHDECTYLYGTLEDITHTVKLSRALKEREQRFQLAFEHAPIGMALVSPRGRWIKVNRSLCQLMGYEEAEFEEKTFQDLTHSEDLDLDLHQMHQLLNGAIDSYSMEKRYFHKDGRIIWAQLGVSLVRGQDGSPLYFISQIKDITEKKRDFEVITEQNSRLLNFAHIVSHNLRSHSGNMQMLMDILKEEQDEEERQRLIEMAVINAANLQETLSHLNEVVSTHNNHTHSYEKLNLHKEVSRTLEVLTPSLRQVNAIVSVYIDPGIVIIYDPAYMDSILLNLLSNCIKYRDTNRQLLIKVSATVFQDTLALEIQDNGIGIDMNANGHKLFGMYQTFSSNPEARGIGLFLVKNQVEAMGGRITAESQPGTGTTFRIIMDKRNIS